MNTQDISTIVSIWRENMLGDYRVYYPSNLLRNARSFENWGIRFSWGIFGHVTRLDQSRPSEKI